MEKKNTQQALADSFKELVLNEPIEKITIKEITDKAGVIRPTFYNHFQDKYELLEWIIKEELISPIIPFIKGGFIREGITLIFANMQKEKEFYTHAAKLEGQNSFESIILDAIQENLIEYITGKTGPTAHYHSWLTPSILAEYYARCIGFITIKWTLSDMALPPKDLATICEFIFESNLDEVIEHMH